MSQERRDQEEIMTEASTSEARHTLHLAYRGPAGHEGDGLGVRSPNRVIALPPTCCVILDKPFNLNSTCLLVPSLGNAGLVEIKGTMKGSVLSHMTSFRGSDATSHGTPHWRPGTVPAFLLSSLV